MRSALASTLKMEPPKLRGALDPHWLKGSEYMGCKGIPQQRSKRLRWHSSRAAAQLKLSEPPHGVIVRNSGPFSWGPYYKVAPSI